jgi:hypothetical protein
MFKVIGSLALSATAWFVVLTSEALARGEGERLGENLGGLLGGWARSLYVGIVAVVALVFLLNRRFADLAVFMVAAVVVGGFVMAPNDIAATVRDIWHTITA